MFDSNQTHDSESTVGVPISNPVSQDPNRSTNSLVQLVTNRLKSLPAAQIQLGDKRYVVITP
mgnify:CR=1 FL=1